MSTNPLVAPALDSTTGYTGLGMVEDAAQITDGIRNNSWVDGTLGVAGASLDMLSLAVDPLGTLVAWGVSWLMEHVKPLQNALDWLAGNADEVAAHAATWANVATRIDEGRREYADRLRAEVAGWTGMSGYAYRGRAGTQMRILEGLATAARGISHAVEGAGVLVALVRGIVRDLIAEFVGVLAVRLPQWLAEEGLTLGLATPLVVGQVGTLVAKWANKIQHFVRGLLNSLRRLHTMLDDLAGVFTESSRRSGEMARAGQGASEFRRDFPTGADHFVDDGQEISDWAAGAYRSIRNSPQDVPAVAANTGLDPRIVDGMHQNLFVQQHDVPVGPNQVERGYFTPDDSIAELWIGARDGTLDADQIADFRSLAAHEYVENRLMEAGLPYRSAHPDAFDETGASMLNGRHPGAHDLAPHRWRPDAPLQHWRAYGLDGSAVRIADDLSNLDDLVHAALRGLGR